MKIDCSIALDILSMANLFILLFGLRGRERSDRAGRAYFQIILLVLAFLSLDVAYLALYGRPWARAAIAAVKSAKQISRSQKRRSSLLRETVGFSMRSPRFRTAYTGSPRRCTPCRTCQIPQ